MAWVLCELSAVTFGLTKEIYYTGRYVFFRREKYGIMTQDVNKAYAYCTYDKAEAAAKQLVLANAVLLYPVNVKGVEPSCKRSKKKL